MEKCQRCGEEGEDRRTLWMACMYEMAEIGIPLERRAIRGVPLEYSHAEPIGSFNIMAHKFKEIPDAKEYEQRFFTMRVCKRCRADWMLAIQCWFRDKPEPEDDGIEAGVIYQRQLGTNRRIV